MFVSQAEHERSLPMPYVKSYAGTDASQHNRGGYLHEGPSTSVLDDEPTSHSVSLAFAIAALVKVANVARGDPNSTKLNSQMVI